VTFSGRRQGLLEKVHELAVLFSVQPSVSPCTSASSSLHNLIPFVSLQQQTIVEIGRLRREYEQLEANLMAYTGEADLSSLASVDELDELETALGKVRARKVLQVPFPSDPTKF
jgi:hypothetical protein